MKTKVKILLVDNEDSFTYNLSHYLQILGANVVTKRHYDIKHTMIVNTFDAIVLSPGPGLPEAFKNMQKIIDDYIEKKPMLGICLGQQAIAKYYGARLMRLDTVYHGQRMPIIVKQSSRLFRNIPRIIHVGRYHSWVVDRTSLKNRLNIVAEDEQEEIMAVEHATKPVFGMQFHPESIMTSKGMRLLENFLNII